MPEQVSKVDALLVSLSHEESTRLHMMLTLRVQTGRFRHTSQEVAALLRKHGHDVSEASVRRWRQINA